jgi:hypothetical protein
MNHQKAMKIYTDKLTSGNFPFHIALRAPRIQDIIVDSDN